jgi:hypothetical protein
MKVSTKTIKSQELGFLLGNQVIFIEGVTKKMKDTVMVKCIGLTEVATKVSGKMEFSMVLARCRFLTVALKKVFLKTTYTNNQQLIWHSKTK